MFRRNTDTNQNSAEMRAIRDTAIRESHPYTDERADYPVAEEYRLQRAQGVQRRAKAA